MAQSFANLLEQDKQVIAPLYGKADINFVKGEGSYLFDDQGNKYLDLVAGIAVNGLGHQNAGIKAAIVDQLNHFNHISNLYPNYPQIALGKKLLEVTGFDKAFLAIPERKRMKAASSLLVNISTAKAKGIVRRS